MAARSVVSKLVVFATGAAITYSATEIARGKVIKQPLSYHLPPEFEEQKQLELDIWEGYPRNGSEIEITPTLIKAHLKPLNYSNEVLDEAISQLKDSRKRLTITGVLQQLADNSRPFDVCLIPAPVILRHETNIKYNPTTKKETPVNVFVIKGDVALDYDIKTLFTYKTSDKKEDEKTNYAPWITGGIFTGTFLAFSPWSLRRLEDAPTRFSRFLRTGQMGLIQAFVGTFLTVTVLMNTPVGRELEDRVLKSTFYRDSDARGVVVGPHLARFQNDAMALTSKVHVMKDGATYFRSKDAYVRNGKFSQAFKNSQFPYLVAGALGLGLPITLLTTSVLGAVAAIVI